MKKPKRKKIPDCPVRPRAVDAHIEANTVVITNGLGLTTYQDIDCMRFYAEVLKALEAKNLYDHATGQFYET